MAGLTREQKAARAAEQTPEVSQPPAVVLVLMSKGEETAEVHPTCVKAHVRAGWAVVPAGD